MTLAEVCLCFPEVVNRSIGRFHRKVRVRPKLAPLAPFHVSAEITSNAFRRSVNVLLAKNADG